jgi:hypothetical protein
VRPLPTKSTKSRVGGLAGASGEEGMLSQSDACGSRGFVGVRGGGRRDSERVATRSRDGRGRGGVIRLRGVCTLEKETDREWTGRDEEACGA